VILLFSFYLGRGIACLRDLRSLSTPVSNARTIRRLINPTPLARSAEISASQATHIAVALFDSIEPGLAGFRQPQASGSRGPVFSHLAGDVERLAGRSSILLRRALTLRRMPLGLLRFHLLQAHVPHA
jgi:hypothetical protein